ncbi:MAG: BamA/TamA family outer membrane protein [bacterium]
MNKKYSNLLVYALGFGMILNFQTIANAKDIKDKDKKVIEAEKILPEALDANKDKVYDQSLTVKSIDISGNHLVKNDFILQNMKTKVGEYFNRDEIQDDLKNIYNIGYFTDKIKAVPEATPEGIKLKVVVEENSPVTGINVSGNKMVSTEDIMKIFNKHTGMPQNITELNKSVSELEKLYSDKGYLLARVSRIADDPDGMINVEVNEGTIDEISIKGNVKTKDYVIKRNILTSPGTIYNENVLKQDLARIYGTQAFSDVRRVITPSTKNPEKYNLAIEVDEKKSGSISLGGGLDTATGLFGTVGYYENNFLGRGQKISASVMTGSGVITADKDTKRHGNFQLEFNFVEPRLKGSLNTLDAGIFVRDYPSFHVPLSVERRIGTELNLSRPIKNIPNLVSSLSMGVENISIKEGDYSRIKEAFHDKGYNIKRRAEELRGGTYLSLGPSLAYDTRNSLSNTTTGWYISTEAKENFKLSGTAGSYADASFKIRKYLPVGKESTLMLSGKVGSNIAGKMPDFASFRLGGASSIRGFGEGDVGVGQGLLLGSAEYRTPIPFMDKITKIGFFRDMRLAAFFDAGRVYNGYFSNAIFDKPEFGVSAGGGLRINMPGVGPIKIDYGMPLSALKGGMSRKGKWTVDFGDRF